VIGSSLSISGALSAKLPNDITPQVAAAITSATAESLAQLGERLATIQLLRDGLFRACEAYANGALSDMSYAILLSRYDDTMVTLLSSELAAGAFGRSLAALSSEAGGTGKSSLDVAEKRERTREAEKEVNNTRSEQREIESKLEAKQSDLNESEKTLNEKRAELSEIESKLKQAQAREGDLEQSVAAAEKSGNTARAASLKSDLDQARKETKKLETEKAQTEKAVAKSERQTSEFRKDVAKLETSQHQKEKEITKSLEDLRTKLEAEVTANAKASATAAGGITRLQDKDVANTIAGIQRKYIENINSDALVVSCIIALDRSVVGQETFLQKACPGILTKIIETNHKLLDAIIADAHAQRDAVFQGQNIEASADAVSKAAENLEKLKSRLSR
jgi:myosin heavy subunit